MQQFEVRYTVQDSSKMVVSEGTMTVPSSNGRYGAETSLKAMFGHGQNQVIIHAMREIGRPKF